MSKERQRNRRKAAQTSRQKPARRPDGSLEESAWIALKRHIVEPFQRHHEDADPEPPSVGLLDRLFELSFRWSADRKASFVPVPTEALVDDPSLEPGDLPSGLRALVAADLLTVDGDAILLLVDPDILARINRGERLL